MHKFNGNETGSTRNDNTVNNVTEASNHSFMKGLQTARCLQGTFLAHHQAVVANKRIPWHSYTYTFMISNKECVMT